MEIFRHLAVKVNGLNNSRGSGMLYEISNDGKNKYVLTAQHCLTNDKNKRSFTEDEISNIEIRDFEGTKLSICDVKVPINVNLDFAVIEINTEKVYPNISIESATRGMDCIFFGFPKYLEADNNPGEPMAGHIIEVLDEHVTLQNGNGNLDDSESDAKENTVGFSGSGLYTIGNNEPHLIGIVIRLRGVKGKHGKLQALKIEVVNNFLKEKNMHELIPYELSAFDMYLDLIINEQDDKVKVILRKHFKENVIDLKPLYIYQKLKHKLFIPYNFDGQYLNVKLWEGWLRLIIYICIYKGVEIKTDTIEQHISLGSSSESNNRFYYSEAKRMATFVRELYTEAYRDISNNDNIFVNSEKFAGPQSVGQGDIHNIIQCIDSVMFENGIDITNENEYKKVKIIHIDHIYNQLETELIRFITSTTTTKQLQEKCVECLISLFAEIESPTQESEASKIEIN
ncbi:ABC-three component system protein [Neobacillus drentensis]|uniref:ABC-three component system protein n=1 Tax=Neobacillus drentensis TaxID=220684 RepID=UPI003000E818